MADDRPQNARKPRRTAATGSGGGPGGEDAGGAKRKKPRSKQCFHCMMPCSTLHRVRVVENGPWESVCDVCWGTRCDGNPHYAYGGLWQSGRLTQPGEQKATAQRKPRKRTGRKGAGKSVSGRAGAGGRAKPAAPNRS